MALSRGLSGVNEDSQSQALPPIDQDPVLMRVQMSLSNQGDEISRIVMAGTGNNSGSGDVMSALLAHLMTERPPTPAPVETHTSSGGGSTAGAIIGASLGALAAGASAAGGIAGKSSSVPAVTTASKSPTPPPPTTVDQPVAKADKPAPTPQAAPQENPQPEVKPEVKPEQTPAPVVAQNDKVEKAPESPKPTPKHGVKKQVKPAPDGGPAPDPNKQAKAEEPAFSYEDAAALMNMFVPVPFFPEGYMM